MWGEGRRPEWFWGENPDIRKVSGGETRERERYDEAAGEEGGSGGTEDDTVLGMHFARRPDKASELCARTARSGWGRNGGQHAWEERGVSGAHTTLNPEP